MRGSLGQGMGRKGYFCDLLVKRKSRYALNSNFWHSSGEIAYRVIKPRGATAASLCRLGPGKRSLARNSPLKVYSSRAQLTGSHSVGHSLTMSSADHTLFCRIQILPRNISLLDVLLWRILLDIILAEVTRLCVILVKEG